MHVYDMSSVIIGHLIKYTNIASVRQYLYILITIYNSILTILRRTWSAY